MNKRGFALLWVVLAVAVALITGGIWHYKTQQNQTISMSNPTTSSSTPVQSASTTIVSLNPTSGPVGTDVTIIGSGFTPAGVTPYNAINFGSTGDDTYHFASGDGKTLHFPVPYKIGKGAGQLITNGTYQVTVINNNGTSNALTFTVTSPNPPSTFEASSLDPSAAPIGTNINVIGSGFTNNTVVIFNGAKTNGYLTPDYSAPAGTLFSFEVPTLPPGNYTLALSDSNRTSKTLPFTITPSFALPPSQTVLQFATTTDSAGMAEQDNQIHSPGSTGQIIAEYSDKTLYSYPPTAEPVNITSVSIRVSPTANASYFQNLRVEAVNANFQQSQFGSPIGVINSGQTYTFTGSATSTSGFIVLADISPSAPTNILISPATVLSNCSGVGAFSNVEYSCSSITGQDIALMPIPTTTPSEYQSLKNLENWTLGSSTVEIGCTENPSLYHAFTIDTSGSNNNTTPNYVDVYKLIDKTLTSEGYKQCRTNGDPPGPVEYIYNKNGNLLLLTVDYTNPNGGAGGKDGTANMYNDYTVSIPDSGPIPQ
jgi:hypothetical protein